MISSLSMKALLLAILICAVSLLALSDQLNDDFAVGNAAIAEKYLLWAEDAIAVGYWSQAWAALERAGDYADVLSDISYLLALVRRHENESRKSVLQCLDRAIGTGRWVHYSEDQARLFQAEQLITLRRYFAALDSLAAIKAASAETIDVALLRLTALKGIVGDVRQAAVDLAAAPSQSVQTSPAQAQFHRLMVETLNRYPRDPRPVRILFDYMHKQNIIADDIALIDIAMRRLPFLIDLDPELAWMAASFSGDLAEARRLVSAYRAGSYAARPSDFKPNPASLVPALNLGLLDDMDAIEELFSSAVIDVDLIINVGNLFRSEEGRDRLAERLHTFTGSITEDEDRDGYIESHVVYRQGILHEYYYDFEQNEPLLERGRGVLFIRFDSGSPQWADFTVQPMAQLISKVSIFWERYPAVQRAELENEKYLYAPRDFQFAPVQFIEIGASNAVAGLLFPRRNHLAPELNRLMLGSFAASIQRPSVEFEGGVEHVYLVRGIPVRAEDMLNGKIVSITEFENGRPVIRRMDLDLDGRMETIRRFRAEGQIASSESDWTGDGSFSSAELYQEDGSVVYSLDIDGSGMRDTINNKQ